MSKRWQLWIVAVSVLLLLVACGDEPEPSPTATPAPPTLVVATTTATAAPPQSVLPTLTPPALINSPLPTTTQLLTQTETLTAAAAGPVEVTCAEATDIALASYPDLQAFLGCALGPAIFDPIAINEFGPGPDFDRFMLWFSHELQIYVLLPNKQWQAYPDTWTEDQPIFACNPLGGEATSPPLPRRGFGKLWCEQALQKIMGTIAKEERLCQHTVLQPFQNGRLLACYEDATIRYIRIMDDGSWDQVLVR